MTKATSTPKVDRTIRLRDGRQMAYSEWGDLGGSPVIMLNGTPGSRLLCADEDATEAARVRLITMDRPGQGRSDPQPGGTLLGWVDDLVELVDHLDLPACPLVGWSGGGPYALAAAFKLPDRVTVLGLAAAVGPSDPIPGIIETDSFSPETRAAIKILQADRAAGGEAFERRRADHTVEAAGSMFEDGEWDDADKRVLAVPAARAALTELAREGARQGGAGWVFDDVATFTPWGFSVTDIRQPVHIWHGEADAVDMKMSADYLVGAIPNATLVTFPGEGHLFPMDHWAEILHALL